MSAGAQAIAAKPRQAPMSGFERYLTLWVALCIVAGVALGQGLPDVFQAIGRMEVAQVNLPVGLLIWVMIVPMLVKIDFGALHQVKEHWRGIGVTLFVNWPSSHSRWPCWGGCSSDKCSLRSCRPINWTATSRA